MISAKCYKSGGVLLLDEGIFGEAIAVKRLLLC